MKKVKPTDVSVGQLHAYILGSVGPRPIALASTIDKEGNRNLSPFSFFNVFSANPPIAIFSPSRRGKDNTTKHTYQNVKEVPEVVINVVTYDIVQQVSLSSTEYAKGVDEFIKSGLTPVDSDLVRPARVAESPVQMECRVQRVIELGDQGGAGNLVISEILLMHIDERIFDENGKIDQHKVDLVGRMGGNWYSRAKEGLFEVVKPLTTVGIGVDRIPEHIRMSTVLTGNDLGILGNVENLPEENEILEYRENHLKKETETLKGKALREFLHTEAGKKLSRGLVNEAWLILLSDTI